MKFTNSCRTPARRAWATARSYAASPSIRLTANDRHLSERGVPDVQSEVGAGGLEDGQRLLDESIQLRGLALRLEVHADHGRLDPPAELPNLVACGRGAVRERLGTPERLVDLACPEQDLDELGLEGEVELGRRHERGCALEEARRRPVVLAERRSLAAGGQAAPRRRGQRGVGR